MKSAYNLLVVLGPTASGKTRAAVEIALALGGEIISADSRQVYWGMDLGTGKDLTEYGSVPRHLIDIVDPGYEFSLFEFLRCFARAFEQIRGRKRLPILAGGTGMYLDAVLRRYSLKEVPADPRVRRELEALSDEELAVRLRKTDARLHNTTDLLQRQRLIRAVEIALFPGEDRSSELRLPELNPVVFGIRWERDALRRRITQRLKERLDQGLIEEVRRLHEAGISMATLEFYGLEYRLGAQYLQGRLNRNDMFQKLNSAIHQFAKRQETWFRRMERQGVKIRWVEGPGNPAASILQALKNLS